jgi:magnesium transporter
MRTIKRKPMKRRSPAGAPPGIHHIDPHAPKPRITLAAYGPDTLIEEEIEDPERIREMLGKHPVTWVNVDGIGDLTILTALAGIFGIHRLALEDLVNVPQRPKVETYPNHTFLVAAQPRPEADGPTEQISLFLDENSLLTFQERPGDCLDPVRQRIRVGRTKIRTSGPDYLSYAVLDAIVDAYYPVVEHFGEALEHMENTVLDSTDETVFNDLHTIKVELFSMRRVVWGLRDMFTVLVRDESSLITDSTRVYFRDCQDHSIQLLELIDGYRESAGSLRDLQLSMLSHRMNEIMKVLTIMATMFIPITFVAGIYGMNFDPAASRWNMPELGWAYGYPAAVLFMLLIAGGLLAYFRRRGWIGRSSKKDR